MAFPTVAAREDRQSTATQSSHVCDLPAGIASGHLLIVFFAVDGSETPGWPAGWTQITIRTEAALTIEARYRVADGSEGSTITVTSVGTVESCSRSWRIQGHSASTSAPEGATAQGNSTTPDPPALDPAGWATEDTLWLACAAIDSTAGSGTFSAFPASYTNTFAQAPNAGARYCGTAERNNAVASEDPGTFTIDAGFAWRVMTMAIRPGSEGTGAAVAIRRTLLGVGV